MEVKPGDDPFADPWEKVRQEKRSRLDKNIESRMRNEERAGNLPKGTTTRVLKSKSRAREAGRSGGNVDRDNVQASVPSGIPVDLSAPKREAPINIQLRGKVSIVDALSKTTMSTASMGRFDKIREGEPKRLSPLNSITKKRKVSSCLDKQTLASETATDLKVLKNVIDGDGIAREKARKKGKLSGGETAYDHDFTDGLGASTFKKKKGRAGAGKMKKMTKKRVK
jgi:regulator of ribosome biosynthesis